MNNYSDINIKAGDHVNFSIGSDTYPATVIKRTAKTVTIRKCDFKLLNGVDSGEKDSLQADVGGFAAHISGTQRYEITEDENGSVYKFTLRKAQGHYTPERWVMVGSDGKSGQSTLREGHRAYYDFNF